jgi:hypothetical protein
MVGEHNSERRVNDSESTGIIILKGQSEKIGAAKIV